MRRKKHRRTRSWNWELLEVRAFLAADLFISEFLASNQDSIADEDGQESDWIELYNAGPDDVNLSGWHLTDDVKDLSKWDFPAQVLPAGNFLLVFASNKDRAVPNRPLHTNFRLAADGEYLALTQSTPAGDTIVSEFGPKFPQQITDVSYGRTQQVESTSLITARSTAKYYVPVSGGPATGWNGVQFDDASWTTGTAAIGYQKLVPGFTVQDAKSSGIIENLSEADAVLAGVGRASQSVQVTPVVNFMDAEGGGGTGNYSGELNFPNNSGGDDNDFAIRATGTIVVTNAGTYTFGTNSDDGVRLRIDDQLVIDDDTLHGPEDRFGQIVLPAGPHNLELVFFERGGGAEVELFAARATLTAFSSRFDLVGDTVNGGLAIFTSPSGGAVDFDRHIETDIGSTMADAASSAYLRIPFSVNDVAALDSLTLRATFEDGFVAYLNGQEIARRNAPEVVSHTSTATVDRSVQDASFFTDINVTQYLSLLQPGNANVLAVQGLNESSTGNEFLLNMQLLEINTQSGENVYFEKPTPRGFNASTGVTGFLLDDVTFDKPHGFYEQAFQVTLASQSGNTTIRYTTDGSVPTESTGIIYSSPISIDRTTTLRARSFRTGTEPSYVATATYLFLNDVIRQSPTGQKPAANWPSAGTFNSQSIDYGMDPDIVNSAIWGPQLKQALTQIPTMSVVMNVDDLMGGTRGIYTHANSHGKAWERPMSLELIHPDGKEGFQVEGGIRIRGGFSRSGGNPKHAFRFFFRDEYGDAKLEYPLFRDNNLTEYDTFDLRTTQNYSWSFGGDGRNTFLRDIFSRDVQGELGQPYTRGDFYHLYLNGQYWGLFQTEERPEASYGAAYFGGNSDDYDVVKSAGSSGGYQNEATDGSLEAYRRLADYFYQAGGLSDANMANYWKAQGMNPDGSRNPAFERLLDVDSVIDYMIITYFTSDADGPGSRFLGGARVNNYFGIFNRENPDGFKFFEHDSEHSLDVGNAAGANYNMVTPFTTGGSSFTYFNPHWMHERLASTNSVYRARFADRVYQAIYHDGPLAVSNAQRLIDTRASQIDMAIIAESARWGDAKTSNPLTKTNWLNAVSNVRSWFEGRAEVLLNQLRSQSWYPTADPPQFTVNGRTQHGGEVSSSDQVGILSVASLNYKTVLPASSTWKYLDDGSNQRTAWRESNFNDTSWRSGSAQFGYGDGDEQTIVGFGPNSAEKFRTTYFRTSFNIDSLDSIVAARVRLMRDDGGVVYLNGTEVMRSNMPDGAIDYETEANGVAGGGDESSFFDREVSLDQLRIGKNVIAVEIHQANGSSTDLSFDLEFQLGQSGDTGGSQLYYTVDGSDPQLPDGTVSPSAQAYTGQPIPIAASSNVITRLLRDRVWSVRNQATFTKSAASIPGDFNADGVVTVLDVELLQESLRSGAPDARFELNGDGSVTQADLTYLVENVLKTKGGDIDLNRQVNFSDFLALSANFGQAGNWSRGSFNTDNQIEFTDFLALSANFGFVGPTPPAAPPQLTPPTRFELNLPSELSDIVFATLVDDEQDDDDDSTKLNRWST